MTPINTLCGQCYEFFGAKSGSAKYTNHCDLISAINALKTNERLLYSKAQFHLCYKNRSIYAVRSRQRSLFVLR
jgi:hypothetical protein